MTIDCSKVIQIIYRLRRTLGNTYITRLTLLRQYLDCATSIQVGHVIWTNRGEPGCGAKYDTNPTGKRLSRIANVVFSASELDNSNKDSQPKMSLNYDVLLRSASKLRVGYRTRAKPRHAHFAAFLVTLTLAQT